MLELSCIAFCKLHITPVYLQGKIVDIISCWNRTEKRIILDRIVIKIKRDCVPHKHGNDISHLCHRKTCVNPDHMDLEDRMTNIRRKQCVRNNDCVGHEGKRDCLLQN